MAGLSVRSFDAPDESRTPQKTKLDVVDLGGVKAARLTAQPGWRWSECIKPVVGGDSCQAHHVGVISSGSMHVVHDDGTEGDVGPGEAYVIEAGHDAWVTSSEPLVAYEFDSSTAEKYAAST
ncbi:cupin domain-containing protein [Aquihabitans sp. McL0605]|uniref:cupin domain-containing protein n=1 Tax=Aquihabitans sp. McL0605 TaxID=3415671 RepID=UPI003CFA6FB7